MQNIVCNVTLNSVLNPEQRAKYQDPAIIRWVLSKAKTIAMVGLSADPQKASNMVASYLQYAGYRIIPVNPNYEEILGKRCYRDLLNVPEPIDIVDIFRPANECVEIVRQAIEKKAWCIWMQLRIVHLEAAELAGEAGLTVVMDKCMKIEHGRYGGSLRWIGANTEIISAKRSPSRE
jgi:predicted CoA-binding protein